MNASIEAAAFDDPMQQGVMAIQMAVAGGHSAATLGPDIVLLTPGTEGLEQIHISPAEYFPALH